MQDLVDIRIEVLFTRENRARFSSSLLILVHTKSPQVLSDMQEPRSQLGLIAVWSRSVIWGGGGQTRDVLALAARRRPTLGGTAAQISKSVSPN